MKSRKRVSIITALTLVFVLCIQTFTYATEDIVKRSDAEDKYKWDLTEFYATRADFEADMDKLENEYIPQLASFKGKLNTAEELAAYLETDIAASLILEKGYVYANLSLDLNQTDSNASEMSAIAGRIYSEYVQAISYVEPELLALKDETLTSILNDDAMAPYKMYLDKLIKKKEHVLSDKEESIISSFTEVLDAPRSIFDKVLYGDYVKPIIQDADGKDIELSSGAYGHILDNSPDRDLRKRAYEARWKSYDSFNNVLAEIYMTEVKANVATAKVKGYNSAIDAALSSEFIPNTVYNQLVDAVNANLEPLHQYYQMRKDASGYEELHGYDTSIPLVDNYNMEFTYDEACDLIEKALAPLGEKYVNDFKDGIASRWVDAFEDDNKYTGGYQWGAYGLHPFILMNYNNSLDSVLTLAHEMGHALNSKYSDAEQNFVNASYPIFTAEVASITNEFLVMDYLINHAKDDKEKLFLLNKQIENIRGTMYVQVMFSEFEKTIHEKVEAGEPVSKDTLNNLWLELLKKYFGEAYITDDIAKIGWSRIPHFYMNFYVYKYATSMAAAYQIVNDITSEKEGSVEQYLDFLAAGGSDYPLEVLKATGVDMTSSKPVDATLSYFNGLVEDMDGLLKKVNADKPAVEPVKEVTVEDKPVEETSVDNEPVKKPGKVKTYIVKANDVLWKIAEKFSTTWEKIAELNELKDPNTIHEGMELVVPSN
ncbi:oligoendopeptidase F [Vallitalea pronyensis]|uniref:Oligopeptidase F n=1 Tax=Vallitalea pronyensis TaxID=1348613 RepID=A0A8J8MJ15_9FIRM|nr:oligoendopeptidase F [Vallitalea pronyensis]QUI22575.1 oligoendopeptidase F [Vallitalea pronyensis]